MAETKIRRRLPKPERMEIIQREAGRLFGERGYAGTKLDDVAYACGITKPALYRHFDSKKALYLALLRRHRDDLPRFAQAAASEPPDARLYAIFDIWLGYVQDHGHVWKMLFRDTDGDPEIQDYRREVQARARETMAALIQS